MVKKKKTVVSDGMIVAAVALTGFVGGMIVNAYSIASQLATKPYVEEQNKIVLDKANDHSDHNHEDMMLKFTELKGSQTTLSQKMDILLQSIQEIRVDMRAVGRK